MDMGLPEGTDDKLSVPALSRSDVIATGLRRFNITPIKAFFFLLVFNLLTNVVPAVCLGAWTDVVLGQGIVSPGLGREPGAWVLFGIAQPVALAYFVWIQSIGDDLIRSLIHRGSVTVSKEVIVILTKGNAQLNSPWVSRVAVLLGILLQGFVIMLEKGVIGGSLNPTWINVHPAVFWSRTLVAVPLFYALVVFVFSFWIIINTLNKIMATDGIRVQQCSPDNAGGLGAIGQFIANLGYLAFSIAAVILVLYWQSALTTSFRITGWLIASIVVTVAYLMITPVFFFLSLHPTHKAMERYRDRLLNGISMETERVYHEIYTRRSESSKSIEKHLLKLRHLDELREFTLRLPIWPFTVGNFRKYYALVSSPVISFVVGLSIEWIAIRSFQ